MYRDRRSQWPGHSMSGENKKPKQRETKTTDGGSQPRWQGQLPLPYQKGHHHNPPRQGRQPPSPLKGRERETSTTTTAEREQKKGGSPQSATAPSQCSGICHHCLRAPPDCTPHPDKQKAAQAKSRPSDNRSDGLMSWMGQAETPGPSIP